MEKPKYSITLSLPTAIVFYVQGCFATARNRDLNTPIDIFEDIFLENAVRELGAELGYSPNEIEASISSKREKEKTP